MRCALLIAFSLLISCNKPTLISGDFSKYILEFEYKWGWPIHNLKDVKWTKLDGKTAQITHQRNPITNKVLYSILEVDKSKWLDLCEAQRRGVIFHELGHAYLKRDHTPNMSYMLGTVQECQFYIDNITALDKEMFN